MCFVDNRYLTLLDILLITNKPHHLIYLNALPPYVAGKHIV